jgi:hypothetical protein
MSDGTLKPASKPKGENFGTLAARAPNGDMKGWVRNLVLFDGNRPDFEDTIWFWFRPSPVRQQMAAVYNKLPVVGMSSQYQSFSHTDNTGFSFEIYWNSLMMLNDRSRVINEVTDVSENERRKGIAEGSVKQLAVLSEEIQRQRKFLEALLIPYETPIGAIGASPAPAILAMPGICTLRVRLLNLSASFQDFDVNGNIKELVMNVTWEEAPMGRVTMRDHLSTGHFRTWGN